MMIFDCNSSQTSRSACVFIILTVLADCACCFDYCNVYCFGGRHTMCLYNTTSPGPACKGFDKPNSVISEKVKNLIVDFHNILRSHVATGKETRGNPGPQPPAANMMELVWDTELETIANRYALQCLTVPDQCRVQADGTYVGQNVALKLGALDKPLSHINRFYKQVRHLDKELVGSFDSLYTYDVNKYTQLVWANTSKIGCARSHFKYTKYRRQTGMSEIFVCNYSPGGNLLGAKIYITGESCTECPGNLGCSSKYDGLCRNPASPYAAAPRKYRAITGKFSSDEDEKENSRSSSKSEQVLPCGPRLYAIVMYMLLNLV